MLDGCDIILVIVVIDCYCFVIVFATYIVLKCACETTVTRVKSMLPTTIFDMHNLYTKNKRVVPSDYKDIYDLSNFRMRTNTVCYTIGHILRFQLLY